MYVCVYVCMFVLLSEASVTLPSPLQRISPYLYYLYYIGFSRSNLSNAELSVFHTHYGSPGIPSPQKKFLRWLKKKLMFYKSELDYSTASFFKKGPTYTTSLITN